MIVFLNENQTHERKETLCSHERKQTLCSQGYDISSIAYDTPYSFVCLSMAINQSTDSSFFVVI